LLSDENSTTQNQPNKLSKVVKNELKNKNNFLKFIIAQAKL